ncbi:MAG: hypothetical protein HY000_18340 [Planctomycetes bacterium]|nr:hypothetical protein [Planctomycetota bacterium]
MSNHFKEPAPNQETILAVFQEEKWPRQIDDPLPPRAGTDPKKRLHDAIHLLNQHQLHGAIRFHGDGTGRRVSWEPVTVIEATGPE